jgi:predicted RNA polymerase sigma factor
VRSFPLDEQDRSLWNQEGIAEGVRLVTEAMTGGAADSYLLQAAIAAVHDEAARAEDTDWPQIAALYRVLMRMSDNPMVALNHAVAVAMTRGPTEGLALLEKLDRDPRIKDHYRLDAVRAHLLERSGRRGRPAVLRGGSREDREPPGAQLPAAEDRGPPRRRGPAINEYASGPDAYINEARFESVSR